MRIYLILSLLFISACSSKKNTVSLPKEENAAENKKDEPKLPELQDTELKSTELKNEKEKPLVTEDNLQNKITPIIIGNVITENQSTLAFLNSGTIEKVYVRAGDPVKQGQVLASLIDIQERIDIQTAEIKLKQKILIVDLQKKKLERIAAQFKAGILNKATYETEKNTYDSSLLDLAETKNSLESKKYHLRMTRIFSPYDGVISQKNKSPGDFVPAGTPIFQITQNKNMEIYAKVPGIYFDRLKTGMTLTVVSPSNRNNVGEIKIRKLVPVLDKNSRTFDLYANLVSLNEKLNPGDFVEIKL